MSGHTTTVLALSVVVAIVLGCFLGAYGFPKEVSSSADKDTIATLNLQNGKLASELAAAKQASAQTITHYVNVSQDSRKLALDEAVADFLAEVEDEDSLHVCGGDEYDFDQVSVSRIYDEYVVTVDKDRNGDTTNVQFEIKLKYSDADTEDKCYNTFNVEYEHEEGEKPTLNY